HIYNHKKKENSNKFGNELKINNFDDALFEKVEENNIYKVLQINEAKTKENHAYLHHVLNAIIKIY
ncbi:unnamed protein product, partial [Rotaria sp. Silwood1]